MGVRGWGVNKNNSRMFTYQDKHCCSRVSCLAFSGSADLDVYYWAYMLLVGSFQDSFFAVVRIEQLYPYKVYP